MENVHLIVGLGNPEAEYARTRHNAGFLAVERLAAETGASWSGERRLRAKLARARIGGQPILLALPQTGMNVSGEAVRALMDYFHAPRERLLVIVDDADLPIGQLRLRRRGSSGGHHGLESIEAQIGSREYARQRLGIGRSAGGREITDYVLGKFSRDERELFDKVLDRACDQVKCWVTEDVGVAMTRFNGAITMTKEAK